MSESGREISSAEALEMFHNGVLTAEEFREILRFNLDKTLYAAVGVDWWNEYVP